MGSHVFGFCLAGLLVTISAGCAVNPVTHRPELAVVSQSTELELGARQAKTVRDDMGLLAEGALTAYVRRIGERLAAESPRRDVPYAFHVVDTPEPNAFAIPGHVYLTRGMLALLNDEDELAGVLAHEVAHVAERHGLRMIQKSERADALLQLGVAEALDSTDAAVVAKALGDLAAEFTGTLVKHGYSREFEDQESAVRGFLAAEGLPLTLPQRFDFQRCRVKTGYARVGGAMVPCIDFTAVRPNQTDDLRVLIVRRTQFRLDEVRPAGSSFATVTVDSVPGAGLAYVYVSSSPTLDPFLAPPALFGPAGREGRLPLRHSFLAAAGDVVLSALKRADDRDALILRVFNPGHEPAALLLRETAAFSTDLAERRGAALAAEGDHVAVVVAPRQIQTLEVVSADGMAASNAPAGAS